MFLLLTKICLYNKRQHARVVYFDSKQLFWFQTEQQYFFVYVKVKMVRRNNFNQMIPNIDKKKKISAMYLFYYQNIGNDVHFRVWENV